MTKEKTTSNIFIARFAWYTPIGSLMAGFVGLIGIAMYQFVEAWALLIIALLNAVRLSIRTIKDDFVVTEDQIILKQGLWGQSEFLIKISDVKSVQIKQSMFQKITGYGRVKIYGNGTVSSLTLPVKHPEKIKIFIQSKKESL